MNLQKFNDIEYLHRISEDKNELISAIKKSNGYVLHVMEKNRIFPSIDILWENINTSSLHFIIKNYDLNPKQIKKIRSYFRYGAENKVTNVILSQEEATEYLKEGNPLPENTVLTLDTIKNNYKELNNQYKKDEYNIKGIMEKSLKNIGINDFLTLDDNFLKENIYIFNINPHLFNINNYQNKYKELLLKFCEENDYSPNIRDFKNYIFTEESKDFLKELLSIKKKSFYRQVPYRDYSNYRGFSKLISKIEYFKDYNPYSLNGFTEKEILGNIHLIHDEFLKIVKENHYEPFQRLASLETEINQQDIVINNDFMDSLFENLFSINIGYIDRDNSEIKEKFNKLQFIFLNYVINNPTEQVLTKIDVKDIAKIIRDYEEDYKLKNTDGFQEVTNKFYKEIFPKFLTSNNLEYIYDLEYFVKKNREDIFSEVSKNNPSINFLTILLNYQKEGKKATYHNSGIIDVSELINEMIPKLDKKSVIALTSYFNYKIPENMLLNNLSIGNFENNFLNFTNTELVSMSDKVISLLLNISEDFRVSIINDKKELSFKHLNGLIHDSEKKENMDFLVKYFSINKEKVLKDENLLEAIITHPLGKKMLNFEANDYEEKQYQKFLLKVKELEQLDSQEPLSIEDENYYKTKEYKIYTEKCQIIKEELNKAKGSLSFSFLSEKIKELLKKGNFEDYYSLASNNLIRDENRKLFIEDVAKSNFNKLLKNIENPYYIKVLEKEIDYNGETKLKFKKFKEEENSILLELLSPQFENKITPFYFFQPEVRSFLNKFVIKHMPLEMFYSYKLRPNIGKNRFGINNSLINTPYTNEELIEGFNKADKIGFFSVKEQNAGYDDVLEENFKGREKEFKELLLITKENNHKLYALLTHRSISKNFYNDTCKEETQDEFQVNYLKNNYDVEIVLKGFKVIIDEVYNSKKLNYDQFNKNVAFSSIQSFIHTTYYDKNVNSFSGVEYFSPLEEKEKHKIIDFLFKEAPYFLMGQHRIGDVDVSNYIASNFYRYNNDAALIDSVLTPEAHMKGQYFSLSTREKPSTNRFNDYVDEIVIGMVDCLISQEKNQELDYISYLLENNRFTEQLSYDLKYKTNTDILDFISENNELMNKLKVSQNKFSLDALLAEKEDKKLFKVEKIKKHKI